MTNFFESGFYPLIARSIWPEYLAGIIGGIVFYISNQKK